MDGLTVVGLQCRRLEGDGPPPLTHTNGNTMNTNSSALSLSLTTTARVFAAWTRADELEATMGRLALSGRYDRHTVQAMDTALGQLETLRNALEEYLDGHGWGVNAPERDAMEKAWVVTDYALRSWGRWNARRVYLQATQALQAPQAVAA